MKSLKFDIVRKHALLICQFVRMMSEVMEHLQVHYHENELTHCQVCFVLTHWGRVTHICVSKLAIIGSDNGLSPGRRQAIIWTNAGILLIRTLGTNFSEILSEIHIFSFKKIHLKMSSGKRRPFCLGLNVLIMHLLSIWAQALWINIEEQYIKGTSFNWRLK